MIDATHDPSLESWVASANAEGCDFPIQNLPLGRYRLHGERSPWRAAVAIGDSLLDLCAAGVLPSADIADVLCSPTARHELRSRLSDGLRRGSAAETVYRDALRPLAAVDLGLPCETRDYTDFYSGIHHARKVGSLLRPDSPLTPNYQWVPIGYHGRASSLVASGTAFQRPCGQLRPPGSDAPFLAPSRRLDFELELGVIVAGSTALGETVSLDQAEAHIAGLTLLNDWSARDIQAWEYVPLGPFLAKNFATTLSPWIVTMEALAPFRAPFSRPEGDPVPLPYLDAASNRASGALDIELSAALRTAAMRSAGLPAEIISRSNAQDAYWTIAQLLTHHTVNGCNLTTGDVLGTGTLSGPLPEQGGSLLELSDGGRRPLTLASGETRTFLEDGDELVLAAHCRRAGFRSIGFGPCSGRVLPARSLDAG